MMMNGHSTPTPPPRNNNNNFPTSGGGGGSVTTTPDEKLSCDSHSISYGVNREKTLFGNSGGGGSSSSVVGNNSPQTNNGYVNGITINGKCKEKERNKYEKVTSTSQNKSVRVSPDSQSEAIGNDGHVSPNCRRGKSHLGATSVDSSSEFPDYLT